MSICVAVGVYMNALDVALVFVLRVVLKIMGLLCS